MDWILVALFLIEIVMVIATGKIAATKNRNVFHWVIMGAIFWPIPFFIIIFAPKLPASSDGTGSMISK